MTLSCLTKRSRKRFENFANNHVPRISKKMANLQFLMLTKTIDQTSLLSLSFSLLIMFIFD